MKFIVSHDVDHLYLNEHWRDTFIPGLFRRSVRSIIDKELSLIEMAKRFSWQLHRINELHAFNEQNDIPATYFFGTRTGLNLSYHWQSAKKHVRFLQDSGVDIGLHGMAYDDLERLGEEKNRIEELMNCSVDGIRNHYLRLADTTLPFMDKLEFKFDSTESGLERPSKRGGLTEFPISLMDVHLAKIQPINLDSWMEKTWSRIHQAEKMQLPYFVVNFHDIYYSNGWPIYKAWYERLIAELRDRDYKFVTFSVALDELKP